MFINKKISELLEASLRCIHTFRAHFNWKIKIKYLIITWQKWYFSIYVWSLNLTLFFSEIIIIFFNNSPQFSLIIDGCTFEAHPMTEQINAASLHQNSRWQMSQGGSRIIKTMTTILKILQFFTTKTSIKTC